MQCDITNEYNLAMMNFHTFQVWKGLMRAVEWNKKEELVADQALRHLKVDLNFIIIMINVFMLIL